MNCKDFITRQTNVNYDHIRLYKQIQPFPLRASIDKLRIRDATLLPDPPVTDTFEVLKSNSIRDFLTKNKKRISERQEYHQVDYLSNVKNKVAYIQTEHDSHASKLLEQRIKAKAKKQAFAELNKRLMSNSRNPTRLSVVRDKAYKQPLNFKRIPSSAE